MKRQLVRGFLTIAVIFVAGVAFIAFQVKANNGRIGHLIHSSYPLLNRCNNLEHRIDGVLLDIYRLRLDQDKDLAVIISDVEVLDQDSSTLLAEEELAVPAELRARYRQGIDSFKAEIHQAVVSVSPAWTDLKLGEASRGALALKGMVRELRELVERRFVEESVSIERSLSGSTLALVIVLGFSMAFSLVVLSAAVRGLNTSLARFLEVIRHLSEGDFSFRLGREVGSFPSEFRAIAGAVDLLADRLDAFHRAERERLSEVNRSLSGKNEELERALAMVREMSTELQSSKEALAHKVEHLEALHRITEFGLEANPLEIMSTFLNIFFPRFGFQSIWIVEASDRGTEVVASLARGYRKAAGGQLGGQSENPDLPLGSHRAPGAVIDVTAEVAARNRALRGMEGTTLLCLPIAPSLPLTILAFHVGRSVMAPGAVEELSAAARTLGLVLENRNLHADLAARVDDFARSNEELRRLNDELEKANRELRSLDEMKDGFISSISHELRTPLAAIKGAVGLVNEMVADPAADSRESVAFIDIASRNCDRLIHLINEILDLSRIQSGRTAANVHPLPLADVLSEAVEVVSVLARERGITITVEGTGNGLRLWADAIMARQILVNLLSNAVKFGREGGRITVAAARHAGDDRRLKHAGSRPYVRLSVSDEGVGIPPEDLERIFDHFYQVDMSSTRSQGGVGLGLAITKGMVEALGGAVWAESRLGEGSDFHVLLPLATSGDPDA